MPIMVAGVKGMSKRSSKSCVKVMHEEEMKIRSALFKLEVGVQYF
jgi:hypothetical protein